MESGERRLDVRVDTNAAAGALVRAEYAEDVRIDPAALGEDYTGALPVMVTVGGVPHALRDLVRERVGEGHWTQGGLYVDCPGCARLVHHSDTGTHADGCRALAALVAWECQATEVVLGPMGTDDPQPARLSGGAH